MKNTKKHRMEVIAVLADLRSDDVPSVITRNEAANLISGKYRRPELVPTDWIGDYSSPVRLVDFADLIVKQGIA
jgi:hypothetical protein